MTQTLIALLLFLFPLAYSPGPGNMFFAANGAQFGFRATLPANLGYHIATWIVASAIGLGFIATLGDFPLVFSVLKISGAGYVMWIAWKMLRAGTLDTTGTAKPASFWDGAILLVLNPKGYVIMALMFSQFLNEENAENLASILIITTVFTLNNALAFTVWTLVGDRIASLFRSPTGARWLNALFAALLCAVAIWMLLI